MSDSNEPPCLKVLTPRNNITVSKSYKYALDAAIENKDVKNIAFTGPYGSGKSSILHSYFKERKENNIYKKNKNTHFTSLASFNNINLEQFEIEKALLQQLFYSLDANKSKYSHINRVVHPTKKKPFFKIVFTSLAGLGIYLYFNTYNDIKILNSPLGSFIIIVLATIGIAIIAYRYSKRFNINKIELGIVSAEAKKQDNNLLNTYLDELIYFFRRHKGYNIFVFEDMDRLDNPNIFIKLREVNKAVNDYFLFNTTCYTSRVIKFIYNLLEKLALPTTCCTPRVIKFIYVLKDDVFNKPEERTKFFDAIISIVPFISYGQNAYEEFKKVFNIKNNNTDPKLKLLKETSMYINDYRLMLAIYNDYNIYKDILSLPEDKLNEEKLLAMMIYKNYYPKDFNQLYYNNGLLHEILFLNKSDIVDNEIKLIDKEISGYLKDNTDEYYIKAANRGEEKNLIKNSIYPSTPLHEVLRKVYRTRNHIFETHKINNQDRQIIELLVLNNYINRDYPIYIQCFKQGDFSVKDRNFIHAINFNQYNIENLWRMPVDNPKFICEWLSIDSSLEKWLNIDIMDYLVENSEWKLKDRIRPFYKDIPNDNDYYEADINSAWLEKSQTKEAIDASGYLHKIMTYLGKMAIEEDLRHPYPSYNHNYTEFLEFYAENSTKINNIKTLISDFPKIDLPETDHFDAYGYLKDKLAEGIQKNIIMKNKFK